jgi:YggT family protein
MLSQILEFLIDTIAGFFVTLLLARFHLQWLRVSFRNQIGQFIIALTNWIVLPARRILPGAAGFDLPTLVVAWLLQAATLAVVLMLRGADFSTNLGGAAAVLFALAAIDLLRLSIYILIFALIVQAVLSWTNPDSPMGSTFDVMVRPFLRPLRRVIPPVSNIDLTPLVLLVLLQVLLIPIAYLRAQVLVMM